MEEQNKKKKGKRHLLIGSVGLSIIGLGFGWWYFFGRKKHSQETEDKARAIFDKATSVSENNSEEPPHKFDTTSKHKTENKEAFPIKYGDKGALVKKLQQGLIKLYGQKILPRYGADGDFKKELQAALRSKGYPSTIDRETFDKIISGEKIILDKPIAPGRLSLKQGVAIARNIWLNAMLRKNDGMVEQLQKIRNVEDYKMVDSLMKTVGQKKALAEVALFAATDDTANELIIDEFKRIGLKYRDENWVLAGLTRPQLVTNSVTIIQDRSGLALEVPEETMLGELISSTNGISSFRTVDDQILYVPTKNTYHV